MEQLTPVEIKRAWRLVTWAGLLGSIYYLACISGAPRIKYLTDLGATAFDFGIISGFGTAVLVFQVFGSLLANKISRRKPIWMVMTLAHRACYFLVLLAPLLFVDKRWQIGWILITLFIHDALAQTANPLWLSWMADLVPKESMSRHWAARQRFITLINILAMIAVAFGFYHFERTNQIILGFSILASLGVIVGIIDILLFIRVPEPEGERIHDVKTKEVLIQPLRDKSFRPFLVFMGYWNFAIFMAAPFFGLYMIQYLGLSVFTVQLISTAGALGVVVSSRFWGLVCDNFGFKFVMQILSIAKIFSPLAFLFMSKNPWVGIPILLVLMFFDGIANSGMGLAMQGSLLKSTPRRNRSMYIAASNFLATGVMAGIAPVLAGRFIDVFNHDALILPGGLKVMGFHFVFALSAILRAGSVYFASRIREDSHVQFKDVFKHVFNRKALLISSLAQRLSESPEKQKRLAAAHKLGELHNPLGMSELIHFLQDPDHDIRRACADALGKIGASEAVEPLARALFDPGSGIQSPAAHALGHIGSVDSLRALLRNLSNLDSESLGETIDSLARIGNDAAIVPLVALFNDVKDDILRNKIAAALSDMTEIHPVEKVVNQLLGRRPLN